MKTFDVPNNVGAPVVYVLHEELERLNDESIYKSVCPVCKQGTLLVQRGRITNELLELDRCVLCGQEFFYVDIENLRKREQGW